MIVPCWNRFRSTSPKQHALNRVTWGREAVLFGREESCDVSLRHGMRPEVDVMT